MEVPILWNSEDHVKKKEKKTVLYNEYNSNDLSSFSSLKKSKQTQRNILMQYFTTSSEWHLILHNI